MPKQPRPGRLRTIVPAFRAEQVAASAMVWLLAPIWMQERFRIDE
jgi:hypothetical protein